MAAVKGSGRIGNIKYHIEVEDFELAYANHYNLQLTGYLERSEAGKTALRINNATQRIRYLRSRAISKYKEVERSAWTVWICYSIFWTDGSFRIVECEANDKVDEASCKAFARYLCQNTMCAKLMTMVAFEPTIKKTALNN